MNIKFKDYKKKFTKIEIDIIPKENTYGHFIYISSDKVRKNIHIYFNDNKEEIKTININENDNVKKIRIIINNKIKSLYRFFDGCRCIKEINFIVFNKADIKNMSYLFFDCIREDKFIQF